MCQPFSHKLSCILVFKKKCWLPNSAVCNNTVVKCEPYNAAPNYTRHTYYLLYDSCCLYDIIILHQCVTLGTGCKEKVWLVSFSTMQYEIAM